MGEVKQLHKEIYNLNSDLAKTKELIESASEQRVHQLESTQKTTQAVEELAFYIKIGAGALVVLALLVLLNFFI